MSTSSASVSLTVAFSTVLAFAACGNGSPRPTSPLVGAARTGDVKAIAALAASGHDFDAADTGGNRWTPLLHAIHAGQSASVSALIAAGADVKTKSPGGTSPLEMAAGNGQADIVRALLGAGADPREPGVFATAVAGGALSDIEQPLLGRCNTEIVRALVERAPDLRLPGNARGHLSRLFARLNHCEAVLKLARIS